MIPPRFQLFTDGYDQPAQVDMAALGFEALDELADGLEARGVDERNRSQAEDDVISTSRLL